MDRKPTSSAHATKPSLLGGFFEGAKSGIFNSTVMMGIFSVLSFAVTGNFLDLTNVLLSVGASTLFTGALGAKKAYDVTHPENKAPVHSPSQGQAKTRSQEVELSQSPSHTRSDWAERTGRSGGSRVAELLKNGSQEERSHAAAILEAREQEANTSASRF